MEPAVEIVAASNSHDVEAIRLLWREYWDSLGFPESFQSFAHEVEGLPGAYAAPTGRLLLARVYGEPAGCAAFRPLNPMACEAKRMYVRTEFRRKGIAGALLGRLVEEARAAGYADMFADTLPTMSAALRMYRDAGFTEVGPYSSEPTPGAVYLKLSL